MLKRSKKDKNGLSLFILGNIFIPLVFGGVFYVFFRTESYISVFILGLTRKSEEISTSLKKINHYLPLFFRNHFCDILWAYALTFSCYLAASCQGKDLIRIMIYAVLFEIMVELLQLSAGFPGTFDPLDMILEFMATAMGTVILFLWKNKKRGNENHEKELQDPESSAGISHVHNDGIGQRVFRKEQYTFREY